jgi:hypothetical protein
MYHQSNTSSPKVFLVLLLGFWCFHGFAAKRPWVTAIQNYWIFHFQTIGSRGRFPTVQNQALPTAPPPAHLLGSIEKSAWWFPPRVLSAFNEPHFSPTRMF